MFSQRPKDEGPKKKKLPPMNLNAQATGSDELVFDQNAPVSEAPAEPRKSNLRPSSNFVREASFTGEILELADPGKLPNEAVPATSKEVLQFIATIAGPEYKLTSINDLKAQLALKLTGRPLEQLVVDFKTGLDLLDRTDASGMHTKLSVDPLRKGEDTLRLATNAHNGLEYSLRTCSEIFVAQPNQIVNAFVAEVLRRFARHPGALNSIYGADLLRDEINRARVTFLRGTPTGLKAQDRDDESSLLHDPSEGKVEGPTEDVVEIQEPPEGKKAEPETNADAESDLKTTGKKKPSEDEIDQKLREKRARMYGGSAAYAAGQAAQAEKAAAAKKGEEPTPAASTSPVTGEMSGIGELKVAIKRGHRERMEDCKPSDEIRNLVKKLMDVKPQTPLAGTTRAGFVASDTFAKTEAEKIELFKQDRVYDAMNGLQSWLSDELNLLLILNQPVGLKTVLCSPTDAKSRLDKIKARVDQSRQQRDQLQSIVTACVTVIAEAVKPNVENAPGLSAPEQVRLIDFASPGMSRIRIEKTSHIDEDRWHTARRDARRREREVTEEKNDLWKKFGDDASRPPPREQ